MKRLTHKDPQTGKIYLYSADADVIGKLTKYEDLEERCIKETTWSLKELLYKWKVFYESIAELYNYRKLEEQGLLLRLPCKDGDTVYELTPFCEICEQALDNEYACENCNKSEYTTETKFGYEMIPLIGKSIFLTKEEAEAALEKMKGE